MIGFVDVPGHEGLVHNMLAGATGIDFVMLVIAADDGVMPQTREHLAIVDLLGLRRGVIALNKCDLVSADRIAAVNAEIEGRPGRTGLEGSEIIPVSAVTGSGVDTLLARLDQARRGKIQARRGWRVPPRNRPVASRCKGSARLSPAPCCRVRSRLETTSSSAPRVSKRACVQFMPRIAPLNAAWPASAAHLCLAGRKSRKDAVHRGDVVLAPHLHAPTDRIDASLRVLGSEQRPIGQWMPVRGASCGNRGRRTHRLARRERPETRTADYVQLVLERPIAAASGDRFVIRDTTSSRTIGGGSSLTSVRLSVAVARRSAIEALAAMSEADPEAALASLLAGAERNVPMLSIRA